MLQEVISVAFATVMHCNVFKRVYQFSVIEMELQLYGKVRKRNLKNSISKELQLW